MRMPGVGDRLGRYLLTEVLGRGGMGTVFAARDEELEREVAVKVINAALAEDEEYRVRFRREALAMSRMDSPHVVSVYDHGEHDGAPYLVTQLVRGGDLAKLVDRGGPLPPQQAVELAAQVLAGLNDAHAVGIVHRDIKPSNVLLAGDGERALLCDFGIATVPGAELTRTGALVGSFPYMSPERHTGEGAHRGSPAADVYAVGCLLWQMLSGTAPYIGTEVEVAMGHMHAPVPQLPGRDKFSAGINRVLRQALAKEPAHRYASARAMRADLMKVGASAPAAVTLPEQTAVRQRLPAVATTEQEHRRRPAWGYALVSAVAVAAIVVAVVLAVQLGVPTGLVNPTAEQAPVTVTSGASSAADAPSSPSGSASVQSGTHVERSRSAGGAAGEPLPGEPAEGDGGYPAPDPPGAPVAPRSRIPAPAPAPGTVTTTATAAPPARYRCWDGSKEYYLVDCGYPKGRRGAAWMFSGFTKLSCYKFNVKGTSADIQAYRCKYGANNRIDYVRWRSKRAAIDKYNWISGGSTWECGNYTCGRRFIGRGTNAFWWSRIYKHAPYWSVTIKAATKDQRGRGGRLVGHSQRPPAIRGEPL